MTRPAARRAFLTRSARAAAAALGAGGGRTLARAQAPAAPAPLEVAGVRFARSASVAGVPLALNGAGVRYRFVVKVYAAGLYLATRAGTPEAVAAAAGPKRLQVVMLRDIDARELGRLFTRGMEDNTPREAFARLIPGTLRMADIFSSIKKLAAGDGFSIDWVPGTGTVVLVNGRAQGEPIREPEFYAALLAIWLGPNPADAPLKDALLGREPRPAPTGGPQQ